MEHCYFHPSNYVEKHWHIYYGLKEGYFEAIALPRKRDNSWDVFFQQSENECQLLRSSADFYDDDFGVFLYNFSKIEVEKQFQAWVKHVLLQIRT